MKNDSDPSYSQEFWQMPTWERHFWLSRSYIEASKCLCQSMLDGNFTSQYSSSRVIVHLARQGLELFFKAAISALSGSKVELTHNLEKLYLEYRKVYPELRFHFELPKRYQVSLNKDLFPDLMQTIHSTFDQRHRYPADRFGQDFASPEVFDPVETLDC